MSAKILLISFYYPPDLSAGAFRSEALAKALLEDREDIHLDIITTNPNRYKCYNNKPYEKETVGNQYRIRRIALPFQHSNFTFQTLSFLFFALTAIWMVRREKYDVVIATSSRLMTACLGASIAKMSDSALYLDIRDIFIESFTDSFSKATRSVTQYIFGKLEKWAIYSASRINVVSAGFLPYFSRKYPDKSFTVFTNGIDDTFLSENKTASNVIQPSAHLKNILYAGNIGFGQGLHLILPELAKRLENTCFFHIIGDGRKLGELKRALRKNKVTNVKLYMPIPRDDLADIYPHIDILFLHLNDIDAFQRVLPSKLFEYIASGKPIWAGVAGYTAGFLTSKIQNCAVFHPCNVEQALFGFENLDTSVHERDRFIRQYNRHHIMTGMAESIHELLEQVTSEENALISNSSNVVG